MKWNKGRIIDLFSNYRSFLNHMFLTERHERLHNIDWTIIVRIKHLSVAKKVTMAIDWKRPSVLSIRTISAHKPSQLTSLPLL